MKSLIKTVEALTVSILVCVCDMPTDNVPQEAVKAAKKRNHWGFISERIRNLDVDKISRWNGDLDTLLIYVSRTGYLWQYRIIILSRRLLFFSTIIVAFNIEFYKQLVPQQTSDVCNITTIQSRIEAQLERTNMLLFAMVTGNASNVPSLP